MSIPKRIVDVSKFAVLDIQYGAVVFTHYGGNELVFTRQANFDDEEVQNLTETFIGGKFCDIRFDKGVVRFIRRRN